MEKRVRKREISIKEMIIVETKEYATYRLDQ